MICQQAHNWQIKAARNFSATTDDQVIITNAPYSTQLQILWDVSDLLGYVLWALKYVYNIYSLSIMYLSAIVNCGLCNCSKRGKISHTSNITHTCLWISHKTCWHLWRRNPSKMPLYDSHFKPHTVLWVHCGAKSSYEMRSKPNTSISKQFQATAYKHNVDAYTHKQLHISTMWMHIHTSNCI